MFDVYLLENKVNHKLYIGASRSPKHRVKRHFSCRDNTPLYKAIRKYGKENFCVRILGEYATEDRMYEKEKHWIHFFKVKHGFVLYNLNAGGRGSFSPSAESRQKLCKSMSKALKGRKFSDSHLKNLRSALKGAIKITKNHHSQQIKISEFEKQLITEMRDSGHTLQQISDELSVSFSTIKRFSKPRYKLSKPRKNKHLK